MAIFNSYVTNYQRVNEWICPSESLLRPFSDSFLVTVALCGKSGPWILGKSTSYWSTPLEWTPYESMISVSFIIPWNDPENSQFLMETSLPTPMTARVYVNLPEGIAMIPIRWWMITLTRLFLLGSILLDTQIQMIEAMENSDAVTIRSLPCLQCYDYKPPVNSYPKGGWTCWQWLMGHQSCVEQTSISTV